MTGVTDRIDEARLRRFRPYPAYRDSGVEWLDEIPAHWSAKRMKFVVPARISKLDTKPDNAVYVGLEHIESWTGRLLLETQPESVDSVVSSFVRGDVLFGKLRPYLAKAARPDFDGVCTSEILPLRPTPGCFQSYMMYCLLNALYIRWLDSMTYGTKMPRVSPDQVGSSHAPLPPEFEQRTIATFLDRETARIDGLVERKERLIELLQEKRTALITRAVTRGLDPNAPMKDSGVEWLGEIPAHWEVKRLHHLLDPGKPLSYGILLPGPRLDDGIPYIGAGDVAPGKLRLEVLPRTTPEIAAAYPRTRMQPGELVYAIRGSFGNVEVIPEELAGVNLSRDAARIGPDNRTSSSWLKFALRSRLSLFQFGVTEIGATITGVNIRDLKRTLLAVPPNGEQLVIAAYLDRETTKIDSLIAKVRQAIHQLKEFRTALISAAVTGKIDVREEVS